MSFRRSLLSLRRLGRPSLAALLALVLLASPAHALVRFNDGRDQIFVGASYSWAYDTNIFASSEGGSTSVSSANLHIDYARRAGILGFNASLSYDISRFDQFSGQNFANPSVSMELTKGEGRTTGSLTLSGARSSRADPSTNTRLNTLNYTTGLFLKYPVIDRYSFSGSFTYSQAKEVDTQGLANLNTYSAAIDLNYVYTSERDLMGGYRLRVTDTSFNTKSYDNSWSAGVTGKLLPKLNGSFRAGYQVRTTPGVPDSDTHGLFLTGSSSWNFDAKTSLTGQVTKDFSTTATAVNIDSFVTSLDLQHTFNARLSAGLNLGYGHTRFLGSLGGGRRDDYLTWGGNLNYTMRDYLKFSVTYTWFENWSTLSFSDFIRQSVTFTVSTRF